MNCELSHVNVVLCCDPKAFTHTNPLEGMADGGCLVWESGEDRRDAWQRIPLWARKQVNDNNIRVYILPGFDIARKATERAELQLRMQGNAFLGAFFAVSPFLRRIRHYRGTFPRRGPETVSEEIRPLRRRRRDVEHDSHDGGLRAVQEIQIGEIEAPDRSSMRGNPLLPVGSRR